MKLGFLFAPVFRKKKTFVNYIKITKRAQMFNIFNNVKRNQIPIYFINILYHL